ncbi:MAG: DUF1574 domain-containing protein [Clostridiales bacterium]|jgi:hypothetical protein|nr:DUF1574 domain-containing protein [Clostridiales bacterium]
MQATSSTSNFKKASAYAIAFVLIYIMISGIYDWAASQNKVAAWNRQRFEDFYAFERGEIDMIFIGSSHAYCTFDPEIINGRLGISSFQLGMPEQNADGAYFALLEVLNYQNPDVVVMDVLYSALTEDFYFRQADLLFQAMDNTALQTQYMFSVVPFSERFKYLIKPIRYQQDFINYADNFLSSNFKNFFGLLMTVRAAPATAEYYRSLGFVFCNYVISEEEYNHAISNPPDGRLFPLSSVQLEYLERIVELCRENDIQLIFATAPKLAAMTGYMENYDIVHNEIAAFAAERGIPYLDFNYGGISDGRFEISDFRDASHLNYSGAVKASEMFCEWFETVR